MKLSEKYNIEYPFQTYSFKSTQELEKKYSDIFNLMLNPKHDHELWLGNINGLLSPSSEYGLAIKLKTYILAGKKLTLVIPENYELHRPDNGRMGFRDEVWKVLRLGIKRGQVFIKTYSIENIEKDINTILFEFIEVKMKFDACIMNPAYKIHLKILNDVILVADTIINISPIRWLQDPLAERKQASDFKKYTNILEKIRSIDIIPSNQSNEIFDIDCGDLGIYILTKDGGFNKYSLMKKSPFNKVLDKLSVTFMDKSTKEGWRGTYSGIFGVICSHLGGCEKHGGVDFFVTNNYTTFCTPSYTYVNKVLFFENETQRKNCFNYLTSKFMRLYAKYIRVNQRVPWQFVPYLDFNKTWTNKSLCDFFNITGYISDTQAVAGSEWEEILNS